MLFKEIINIVSRFYNLDEGDIFKCTRRKEIVEPRWVVMFLLRKEFKYSFSRIAREFGGKDHTTVIHACKKISERLKNDVRFKDYIDKILLSTSSIKNTHSELDKNNKPLKGRDYLKIQFQRILDYPLGKYDLLRQADILQKYQAGINFREIGKIYNLSSERIRQIVLRGLLFEASEMFRNGVDLDIDEFIKKKKKEHVESVKKRNGVVDKIIVKKEKKWSRWYDYCRKCGTKKIEHRSNGYCEWCYYKSDIFKKIQKESHLRRIKKKKRID